MMFSLRSWILMCAAFCILSSRSSNAGVKNPLVSLTCNKTVEVDAGITLTLNCTIQLPLGEDCRGDEYIWQDSNKNNICGSTTYGTVNYTCEWDNETYVSLVIREVAENQTYIVSIWTSCGNSESYITVKVRQNLGETKGSTGDSSQDFSTVITVVIASVFSIVLVLGILSALFTRKRGKEILKCVKRGKNPEYMDASQACSVNSGV